MKRARAVFSDDHAVEIEFEDEPAMQLRAEKFEDLCISEVVVFKPMPTSSASAPSSMVR